MGDLYKKTLFTLFFFGLIGLVAVVYTQQQIAASNAFLSTYTEEESASPQDFTDAYAWNRWAHQYGWEVVEPSVSDVLSRFRSDFNAVLGDTLEQRFNRWMAINVTDEDQAYFIDSMAHYHPSLEYPYMTSDAVLDGAIDLTKVDAQSYQPLLDYIRLDPAVFEVCNRWAPTLTLLRQEHGCTDPTLCRYDSICQTVYALQQSPSSSTEAPFATLRQCIPSPDDRLATMRRIYTTLQQEKDTLPHQVIELVSETIPQTLHLYTETGTLIYQTTLGNRPMPFDLKLSSNTPTQRLLKDQTYKAVTQTSMPEGIRESSATFRYNGRPTIVFKLMNSNTQMMFMSYKVERELMRRSQQRLNDLSQATLLRKRTQ